MALTVTNDDDNDDADDDDDDYTDDGHGPFSQSALDAPAASVSETCAHLSYAPRRCAESCWRVGRWYLPLAGSPRCIRNSSFFKFARRRTAPGVSLVVPQGAVPTWMHAHVQLLQT